MNLKAVLFDLDGTLLDTAADIAIAINTTLECYGHRKLSLKTVSEGISHGAAGIFSRHLDIDPNKHQELINHFMDTYQQCQFHNTHIYDGIKPLLAFLKESNIKWGVVTNKSERFTLPILKKVNLLHSAACVVSGDSTAYRKPHPAPVLLACEQLNIKPQHILLVGDHEKDIKAGHAAGTCTAFAKYGYIDNMIDNINSEQKFLTAAKHTIQQPIQLLDIIKKY
ncbi:Similar to phosphoglycolate phosphatase, clustered with ubiquinone biosynthesis SAM-dependent O-methyltransferase [hydrothermal vent metagenome]|uniref:Similar to phosphoglycolate phosphatase, clustered with ubiquinone biosynthesis SAM-dependent O-methyltransferase n=1 Tax=hydrothermal vent metagenome TaxID=652676 RepID=A0A3B0Y353_9ZZZZ